MTFCPEVKSRFHACRHCWIYRFTLMLMFAAIFAVIRGVPAP